MGSADALVAPTTSKEFSSEWARRIIVAYKKRLDPEWMLESVIKVYSVMVTENPTPGMLSNSYIVQVCYKIADDLKAFSWFVKVPKSPTTSSLDATETFMYNVLFPALQTFADQHYRGANSGDVMRMPIPAVFHAHYDAGRPEGNHLVMQDLGDSNFQQIKPETCSLAFMRASMNSLSRVHATAFALRRSLGGRKRFLKMFPELQARKVPRLKTLKALMKERLRPYLEYLAVFHTDLRAQLGFLIKFSDHLYKVFKTVYCKSGLDRLRILIHGDSKIDNFLCKKVVYAVETEYTAVLVDWQGACYDFLSSDLIWSLYGFMKNLPEKNTTVDTFLDYSLAYYHNELTKNLKGFGLQCGDCDLPEDEYDFVQLAKKGFICEFMKVVLVKPLVAMIGADKLVRWSEDKFSEGCEAPPPPAEVFRSGESYMGFIHLFFTIATEIGVFHDLGPMCITSLKEAMFRGFAFSNNSGDDTSSDGGDSDSDDERNLLAQTADILKDLENGSGGGGAEAKDDHESAETGGCDEDDDEKLIGDVDHESAKGPSAAADDASAGEEMVTAAEDDPTDPGLSIPEQGEAVEEAEADGDLAGKRSNANGPSSSLVVAAAANNKHLNSVSTCSELSEDELYQDVDSGDAATDQEKESFVVVPQERKSSLPDVLEDSSEGENDVSVVYGTIYVKKSPLRE